jgi:hypothetical protein
MRVLLALSLVTLIGTTAHGEEYEITSTEGGDSKGSLTVEADYSVVRRVTYPDTSIHTYTGKGQLSGATLTVQFDGAGEPRDLTGEWSLEGESERGRFHATARFGLRHGRWLGTFQGSYRAPGGDAPQGDEDETTGAVELEGRFEGLTFACMRKDGTASLRSASYTLSPDGLKLAAHGETFTRTRLPASGGPTVTYSFQDGGRVAGALPNGLKDSGTKVATKAASDTRRTVQPDPFPSSLRAVRETAIYKGASKDSAVARTVKLNEMVPVCGRENGFWTVGPFKEAGQRRWTGYLPEADLDNRLRYADVPAPIFLPGTPPSASSVLQKDLGTCYLDAALMAIASVQSRAIESMIRDHGDGTVSVRFYRRAGGTFEAEWVRIRKTIIVDERGRSHYTVGEGGQLWPALIEKAFAVWRGEGWYRNIEGGNSADVFEVVLGMQARNLGWNVPLPAELGQRGGRRGRSRDLPSLGAADLAAINSYRASETWKKESEALQNRPAARRDIAYVDSQLEAAGLSREATSALHGYYAGKLDGPLGSGKYSAQAKEVFTLIKSALEAHLPVAMSTRSWGAGETTLQGRRENLQLVAGLASSHEYMVTEAYEDENHLLWIKVVNPWHRFTRRYERVDGALVARAASGRDGDRGAFAIELSDVMRYYSSVACIAKR